jgi:acyl carrier protein
MTDPSSDIAQSLAQIWQRTLRIEDVDIDDDFFDLGGNSIAAIRLIPLISERFGVEPDVTVVFDYPTPRTLAGALMELGAATDGTH